MKQIIINIISSILQSIDVLLCKLRVKRPVVVIYMDGGICSQMVMYLQGQYYFEAGCEVYYDTLWFDIRGKYQYGVHSRIFELTEMWPSLEFNSVSKLQRKWYLLFFNAKRINGDMLPRPDSITHSLYLNGWWDLPNEDFNRLWNTYYNLKLAANPTIRVREFANTIGIHVRRGDLAKGDNPVYGGVTDGYFLRAIEFCNEKFHPQKYLFFSDEPDWVEENICNHLDQPYEIMRGNKAWEDLWLLSQCPVIVASQGSYGTVAAKLNPAAVLIQCDNEHANRERKNTYFIK